MTDRISIPTLRERNTSSTPGNPAVADKRDVLALVEAVEAARRVVATGSQPASDAAHFDARAALDDALARFDFGEENP